MYAYAVDGSKPNHVLFSNCSLTNIGTQLTRKRNTCFIAKPTGFCGNGLLEGSEACDAGIDGDACCTSSCTLKPGKVCSDANHECCTGCAAAGPWIHNNGTVLKPGKVCFKEFNLDSNCQATTYCTNASFVCPTIGEKPAGTACLSEGQCQPNTNVSLRCQSFCSRFGAVSCTCTAGSVDECRLCCVNSVSVKPYCPPGYVYEYRVNSNTNVNISACFNATDPTFNSSTVFITGKRPFGSTCSPVYSVLTGSSYSSLRTNDGSVYSSSSLIRTAGDTCSSGSCNSEGKCVAPAADTNSVTSLLASFSVSNAIKYMKQNVVGTVFYMTIFVWVPPCIYLCIRDRRRLKKLEGTPGYVKLQKREHTFTMRTDAPKARPSKNRIAPAPIPENSAPAVLQLQNPREAFREQEI